MAYLQRISNDQKFVVELREKYVIFGRSDNCDVILEDVAISREHCGIRKYEDQTFTVIDFGSRNGTFVNNEQIFEETRLYDQDKLRIGTRIELTFCDPDGAKREKDTKKTADGEKKGTNPKAAEKKKAPKKQNVKSKADPALARAINDVQDELEERSFRSLFQDIIRQTRKKPKNSKKQDQPPNQYW